MRDSEGRRSEWCRLACEMSLSPFEGTVTRLRSALANISPQKKLRILVFTTRPEYFDASDLFDPNGVIKSVYFADSEDALETCTDRFDFALVCTHILQEHKAQFVIRQKGLAPLIVLWTWDNHHHYDQNLKFNSLGDIILPAHFNFRDELKTPHAVLGRLFFLPTSQWARALASRTPI